MMGLIQTSKALGASDRSNSALTLAHSWVKDGGLPVASLGSESDLASAVTE
jgi:hypothetical protein